MTDDARMMRLSHLDRTDPPRVNIELLQQVWETIQANLIVELADQYPDQVHAAFGRTELDGWDQARWRRPKVDPDTGRCGTALCLAGWTAQIDAIGQGDESGGWLVSDKLAEQVARHRHALRSGDPAAPDDPAPSYEVVEAVEENSNLLRARDDDPADHTFPIILDLGGARDEVATVTAETRARRLLGLTRDEAAYLFASDNTLENMATRIAKLVMQERIRRVRRDALNQLHVAAGTDNNEENSE